MFPSISSILVNDLFFTCFITLISLFLGKFIINLKSSHKVYLIDFACYKPKMSQQITREKTIEGLRNHWKNFTQRTILYQRKLLMSCGIGDLTYASESLLKGTPDLSMEGGRREAEAAIYGAVDDVLAKTKIKVEHIGVLVVCCSLFNPTPSLTAMIVNKYKLKPDIKSYNLSGMGCSAGIAAMDLAKHLLQVNENTYALVVSTEVISPNVYIGNDLRKVCINSVFRVGGSAILLSNRESDRQSSKYQLIHTVRTNTTRSDTSYRCIFQEEDSEGFVGVTVNQDLLVEANKAITAHITTVAKLVLPTSEKILFALNFLLKMVHQAKLKPYTPDFRRAIDHLFPHVGASIVIDEVERNLKLDTEAPRMTLYRFGNLSSSTVWYELAYAEPKTRIKKGDCLWQIAFGSGFKCSSVIWHAAKTIDQEKINPWSDEIDDFPVQLSLGPLPSYFKETT